jgi:hypothetical protein
VVVGGEEGMEETSGMEGIAVDGFGERGEGEECQRKKRWRREMCGGAYFLGGRLTV